MIRAGRIRVPGGPLLVGACASGYSVGRAPSFATVDGLVDKDADGCLPTGQPSADITAETDQINVTDVVPRKRGIGHVTKSGHREDSGVVPRLAAVVGVLRG